MKRIITKHVKYCLYTICLALPMSASFAQTTGNETQLNPLKTGDCVPDIPLVVKHNGTTINTTLSAFRNKLVIIDFWTTGCPICIRSFPHMEELQAEFGDKIIIFTANARETEEQIKIKMQHSGFRNMRLSHLPAIVNAAELMKLFPHVGVPFHVWIDQKGLVQMMGSGTNTHTRKIRSLLSGSPITFIPAEVNALKYDPSLPFFASEQNVKDARTGYYSNFSGFQRAYGIGRSYFLNNRDSASQTVRNSFINVDLIALLQYALKELSVNELEKAIFTPGTIKLHQPIVLQVKDSLSYTTYVAAKNRVTTDEDIAASSYCYEQILHWSTPDSTRLRLMFNDVQQEIQQQLGAEVFMDKVSVPAYAIVRTTKKRLPASAKQKETQTIRKKGTRYNRFLNQLPQTAILTGMQHLFQDLDHYIIDATDYTYGVDMILPQEKDIANIEQARKALAPFGMDIKKIVVEAKQLMIQDKGFEK